MSTVSPSTTPIVVPTTTPIATRTTGISTTTRVGSSTTTTRGSVPYAGNPGQPETYHLSKGTTIAIEVVLAVVMSGLFLVFLWYQCNKRRRARSIPLTRMSPTRATSLPKLETEAEKGEAGFTAGVLPFRSPTASMPSHVSESHLPQGYQPVYVESAVPWVKAGNYSISDPNPGPLSPSYALSWAAPPPRDSPTVLPVQKETHLPGSHRDETWTGGNVMR